LQRARIGDPCECRLPDSPDGLVRGDRGQPALFGEGSNDQTDEFLRGPVADSLHRVVISYRDKLALVCLGHDNKDDQPFGSRVADSIIVALKCHLCQRAVVGQSRHSRLTDRNIATVECYFCQSRLVAHPACGCEARNRISLATHKDKPVIVIQRFLLNQNLDIHVLN
jgi:hypothetical protein